MYHDTRKRLNGHTPQSTGRVTFQRSQQDFYLVIFDAGHFCVCHISKSMLPTHLESGRPNHLHVGFVFGPFHFVLVSKGQTRSLPLA